MASLHARLTHIGVHAVDLEKMMTFYTNVMGLMVADRGRSPRLNVELIFMSAEPGVHHQLVIIGGRPNAEGFNHINQISFRVDSLAELREVAARAKANGVETVAPVSHGNAWSIYFKDPEGNGVEVYLDTPWHIPQPHGDPLDLSKSDEDIYRETEAICRADPGFMPMEAYREKIAARMAG